MEKVAKKVFIQTWGCQMNEYDTELVKSILAKANYSFVAKEAEADIIMLNTCAIRENAHRKIYGRIHEIHHKRNIPPQSAGGQNSNPVMIGILGCMATNLRTELFENKGLKIDFIAGPDSYKRLPDLIREAQSTGEKQFDLTLSEFETYSDIFPNQNSESPSASPSWPDDQDRQDDFSHSRKISAWIAVSRGCNNFCTFCVVPYTRGRERSRSPENIVDEVKRLADEGFKQITLLGQNVNSYQYETHDFAYLLEKVSGVDGIKRIRFTSPHPKDFPESLLNVIAQNPKVCKQVHLPLQAGNNRILDLMNRTYTQEEFLKLVDRSRELIPNISLSTDIIVGFCSETDKEFEDTLDVIKKVEFDSAFTFKYSERKQTNASKKMKDDVPAAIKTERIMRLNEIQKEITFKKNQAHIGQVHTLLVEKAQGKHTDNYIIGRMDNNKIVTFDNHDCKPGDFVNVKITSATPHALRGIRAI